MAANWMRRSLLAGLCASAAVLAACGSSSTESAIKPQRFIAFGDGFADVGQVNGRSYSINDGSINNWTREVAARYGLDLKPVSAGGTSYAQGNARISTSPDAAGNASTPTLTQQIDRFLAQPQWQTDDVILISAGTSDLIAGMAAVQAGSLSEDQYLAASRQAGQALAAQVKRLSDAGGKHIVVTGSYDMSRSPWAKGSAKRDLIGKASTAFNQGLLVQMEPLGKTVLYVDLAYYVNVFEGTPGGYGFENANDPICTSVDSGAGIGIGSGEINSALCTDSTLVAGADARRYLFADKVYLTPSGQRQFGTYAYDKLHARW